MQVRCVHCSESMEVHGDSDFSQLTCESCGGSFSLVGEETAAFERRTLGHFELLHQVGVGAFGSVWKARDSQLDRMVALKVPRKGDLDAAEVEQFLREARAAAQLRHANIVGVHEVGRDGDSVYIVSDFVEGANLDDWLSGHQLTPRESAELAAKIADALHHAHEAGVIHRDLKPGNIMLDLAGEPHLMDFGLARRTSREVTMSMEGRILGTPAYMSPEQARGDSHQADCRSDVYSLGVVLFRLLTGELPFRGTPRMLLVQIQRDEPPRLRQLNGHVPRPLEIICLKCLEKNPERRYASAADLAADLHRWLSGEAIHARPAGRIERAWRWCKRRPVLATAAGFLLLISFVAPAVALKQNQLRQQADKNAAGEAEQRKQAEQARDNYRDILYKAEMHIADRAWQDGNIPLLREILERHAGSKLKGFEWHYLRRLYDRSLPYRELLFEKEVRSIAFSSDESQMITQQGSGGLAINDFLDARTTGSGNSVAHEPGDHSKYFPDSHLIVSWNDDRSLTVWDANSLPPTEIGRTAKNYNEKPRYTVASEKSKAGTAPETFRLAVVNGETRNIDFWSCSKEAFRQLPSASMGNVKPDELFLSSGSTHLILHVHSAKGLPTRSQVLDIENQKWLDIAIDDADQVYLSPNGKYLAARHSPSQEPGTDESLPKIGVYSLKDGTRLGSIAVDHRILQTVVFHPHDPVVAITSMDFKIRLWRFESQEVRLLEGHRNWTSAVAFSADGQFLASGAADNIVRVWDVATGEIHRTFKGHVMPITRLAFSPKGTYLASKGLYQQEVKIWKVASQGEEPDRLLPFDEGESTPPARHQVDTVAISGDASLIASADRGQKVCIWESATGKKLHVFRGFHFDFSGVYPGICVLAFRPDGDELAVVDESTVKLFSLDAAHDRQPRQILENPVAGPPGDRRFDFVCVSFSPDGRWLAAGMRNGQTVLWNLAAGNRHVTLPATAKDAPFVRVVEFSPDSQALAVGSGNTLSVWKLSPDGTLWNKSRDDIVLAGGIFDASFSPDGKELLAVVGLKRLVTCYTETGKAPDSLKLDRHTGFILTTTFLPDGRVLSGGSNLIVNCWDYERGDEFFTFAGHTASILSLSVSRDGETFVSSSDDGSIRIWRAAQDAKAPPVSK